MIQIIIVSCAFARLESQLGPLPLGGDWLRMVAGKCLSCILIILWFSKLTLSNEPSCMVNWTSFGLWKTSWHDYKQKPLRFCPNLLVCIIATCGIWWLPLWCWCPAYRCCWGSTICTLISSVLVEGFMEHPMSDVRPCLWWLCASLAQDTVPAMFAALNMLWQKKLSRNPWKKLNQRNYHLYFASQVFISIYK